LLYLYFEKAYASKSGEIGDVMAAQVLLEFTWGVLLVDWQNLE